jgi:hypothetical protein
MGVDQRDKVVREFKEDPDVKVLLISLKAGGVALNLTVANYIYLMGKFLYLNYLRLGLKSVCYHRSLVESCC